MMLTPVIVRWLERAKGIDIDAVHFDPKVLMRRACAILHGCLICIGVGILGIVVSL